jgi:hypothetical protein
MEISEEAKMPERTEIIPVQMPDGSTIQVMATMLGPRGTNVSAEKDAIQPFDGVLNSIESIASSMVKALKKAKPHKTIVEFGVEVAFKEGVLTGLLVKGSTTGNLTITLEWEETE